MKVEGKDTARLRMIPLFLTQVDCRFNDLSSLEDLYMERAVFIHSTGHLKLFSEGREMASLAFGCEREAHDWATENFPEAVFSYECATNFGLLKSNGPGVGGTQVIPVFEN